MTFDLQNQFILESEWTFVPNLMKTPHSDILSTGLMRRRHKLIETEFKINLPKAISLASTVGSPLEGVILPKIQNVALVW